MRRTLVLLACFLALGCNSATKQGPHSVETTFQPYRTNLKIAWITKEEATFARWHQLKTEWQPKGWWPIFAGGVDDIRAAEDLVQTRDVQELLKASEKVDVGQWLASREKELTQEFQDKTWIQAATPDADLAAKAATDLKPDLIPDRIAILLVPTTRSWETPAYKQFGGWNDCPNDDIHIAVLRRWHELYGAEVVSMTHDVIELAVKEPLRDPKMIAALAREQALYAPDIVLQGSGTATELAKELCGKRGWFFWWD